LKYACTLVFFAVFKSHFAFGQPHEAVLIHQVFLAGNTADFSKSKNLDKLDAVIREQSVPVTLIYCGDAFEKEGKDLFPRSQDSAFIRSLLEVGKGRDSISIYVTPGDAEWDHSGKNGWKEVKSIEKLVNGIAGNKIFLPSSACPGPEKVVAHELLEIVFISTPWLIHPYEKPSAPDDDCRAMSEEQFAEILEDVVEEAKDRHLLIVGHHPVLSNGMYGGKVPLSRYLSPPIIGSFRAGYHQNIGSPQDLAYPAYRNFSKVMKTLMQDYPPFIYASAHENNLQVLREQEAYQVISGSLFEKVKCYESANTVYRSNSCGFISLSYFSDGRVTFTAYEAKSNGEITRTTEVLYGSACESDSPEVPLNTRLVPCEQKNIASGTTAQFYPDSTAFAIAGEQYKAGFIKKIFLGKLYRSSWSARIKVPVLNLDTVSGGLTATGTGGGRQTLSLSLTGGDGKSYVFRSVDKDPVKALSPRLRKTFVAGLARQFTATQQPYGALLVGRLLDSTTILHATPHLYLLPDDKRLGVYQKRFGGMLGMLEEKPKKRSEDSLSTFGANEITRSFDMFRKLYKDHDNRVDEKAFLEARIFDMWIGDWGRHEDNWKWAGYHVSGKETIYRPIPRDRDHAFSLWNGILPYMASRRWALPNAESFEEKFKDIRSLNFPARHLDRFLLSSLSRANWTAITKKTSAKFTDAVIDSAMREFPQEVASLSGGEIGKKLKRRRDKLLPAALAYYRLLAKSVSVVGSNKAESFLISRLPDNSVVVTMSDLSKSRQPSDSILYQRIFYPRETQYINIYGLDGDDVFTITGTSRRSIRVRIFGGKGTDSTAENAGAKRNACVTKIYDYKSGEENYVHEGVHARTIYSDNRSMVEFNRQPAHYHTYLPLPLLYYTPEDGFAAGLGLLYIFHRFGEDDYHNKLKITNRVSTRGNLQIKISDEFHHVAGNWDLLLNAEVAQPYPTTHFYGAGNETAKLEPASKNYYKSQVYGYAFFSGLQCVFWKKSSFILGVHYERNNATLSNEVLVTGDRPVFGLERLDYFGPGAALDIDFRDNAMIPKQGVRFTAGQTFLHFNVSDKKDFGNSRLSLEMYQTHKVLVPLTLGLKGGLANNTGDVPYYKLNTLGRTTNLSGYARDRFSGRTAAYLNSQLSAEFGTLNTAIAPLTFGIYTFYDFGRVWMPGENSGKVHAGYGAGLYLTPLFEILTTRISISFSEEETDGIVEAGLGIGF
jgi:hypothetical protein